MSFLWHDYETFGTHPALDRPCQFAAQRTDDDLNPVGEPVVLYCAPADDVLPHPGACLVTGITPQEARVKGIVEAEFAQSIQQLMTEPNTCSAGYNSLKFDDEVTRHLLYRNLFDPYEREWKNGNSRWDLINLMRMCYALRPEGVEWPMVDCEPHEATDHAQRDSRPITRPSFKLEDLAAANGIEHTEAHDALADVEATVALARIVRRAQPRLFEWSLDMRNKQRARELLDPKALKPVIHTSGRILASRGCTTLVLPLVDHPDNDKAVIVFDLMGDADALAGSSAESLRERVFTPHADLPEGVERLPLKAIKWNAVPMLAPASVLRGVDLDRIGLDLDRCRSNAARIEGCIDSVRRQVSEAFRADFDATGLDPDLALYRGGFFSDSDRRIMASIRASSPEELGGKDWSFQDPRLPLMLLRYRARNWPDSLDESDWAAWECDRKHRLTQPIGEAFFGLEAFRAELALARENHRDDRKAHRILDALERWSMDLHLED